MEDLLESRRREIDARGLMSYPSDDADDLLRIDGIRRLLSCMSGTIDIRLPGRDIVVPWDASLPPQLAYYVSIGDYEHHDLDFAAEFVQQGDVVMELGGGIGITGTALAKASGNPVVVVEPNPALHEAIGRTFAANGVEAIVVRAAATAGTATMTTLAVDPNYWWSSLEPRSHLPGVEVDLVSLADLLDEHRPTVLAVDIEGHERALVGTDIHECVRRMLFEIHTPDIGTLETGRIVTWIQRQGFVVTDVRANSWAFSRS